MRLNHKPTVESVLLPHLRWWFGVINKEYFDGRLRLATIAVRDPGTEKWAGRYHHPEHLILFSSRCLKYPLQDLLETLAHEMTHAWQYAFGSPGANNYHNAEFQACLAHIGIKSNERGADWAAEEPFISFLRARGVDARPWSRH